MHCRARPREPAKYASQTEQDASLPDLLDWVRAYTIRTDDMSLAAYRRLFDWFPRSKLEIAEPLDGTTLNQVSSVSVVPLTR